MNVLNFTGIKNLTRSFGYCSSYMKEDLDYIINILKSETDIIKRNEYKNHLMIITNNCNGFIISKFDIDKDELDKAVYKATFHKIDSIKFVVADKNSTYETVFNRYNLLKDDYLGYVFLLKYNTNNSNEAMQEVKIISNGNGNGYNIIGCDIYCKDISKYVILNKKLFKIRSLGLTPHHESPSNSDYHFHSIYINNERLSKAHIIGGYKSTKQKISVIIDKKPCDRTVYKNAKGISYIRCNNKYKLLKKYKLVKK